MTTYNTGNPVGSTEVKDLYDNAENLDIAINSPSADAWTDRLGQARKTWRGIQNEAQLEIAQVVGEVTAQSQQYLDASIVARDEARAAASASGPIAFFSTYAAAQAAAGGLPANGIIEVSQDETRAGARTRYKVQGGALVFVVNLDQLRLDLAEPFGADRVGYTPSGAGAVATTVQIKLREIVSVKDFGAVGDGVTDDTAAIQAAANSGKSLYFPAGTYNKSAAINFSASDIAVYSDSNAVVNDTANGYTSFIFAASSTNITVQGLAFFGVTTSSAASSGYAIFVLENSAKVRVKDCTFAGYTGGIAALVNVNDIEVSGCRFADMAYIPAAGVGGYGVLAEACSGVRILNNYFAETVQRHHVYASRNAANPTALSTDWVISNNIFYSKTLAVYETGFEFACKLMGTQGASVSGNTFSGGCGHVWLTEVGAPYTERYTKGVVIDGNVFSGVSKGNSTDSGCVVSSASTVFDVTVSNNKMRGCAAISHVYFSAGSNAKVIGNTIYNSSAGHGVTTYGAFTNLEVSGNTIEVVAGARGVSIGETTAGNSPGLIVKGNTITGGAFGIFMRQADDAFIDSNKIASASDTGVYILAGNFAGTIRLNEISSGDKGVSLPAAFTGFAWVYRNRFSSMALRTIFNQGTGWVVEPYGNNSSIGTYQRKAVYNAANAAPAAGTWGVGDVSFSDTPPAGGFIGYVCVVAGTPGTWKAFGAVAP